MTKNKSKTIDEEFQIVFEKYKNSIFSFCMAKLNCDVFESEDCVQETFTVYYKKIKSNVVIENPRAFFYKTALNFIKTAHQRKQKTENNEYSLESDYVEIIDKLSSAEGNLLLKELEAKINELLSDEELNLYKLKFIEDKGISEIANELGITTSTCATRLSRLRTKLKVQLKEYI